MSIDRLKRIGRDHLSEHLPRLYRELAEHGELEAHLERAARHTQRDVDALVGVSEILCVSWFINPGEAWEMVRERHLILPAEEDDAEEPHPKSGIFYASRSAGTADAD